MSKSRFEESDHRQSKLNKALLGSMYDFEVSDEVDDESAKEAVVSPGEDCQSGGWYEGRRDR